MADGKHGANHRQRLSEGMQTWSEVCILSFKKYVEQLFVEHELQAVAQAWVALYLRTLQAGAGLEEARACSVESL